MIKIKKSQIIISSLLVGTILSANTYQAFARETENDIKFEYFNSPKIQMEKSINVENSVTEELLKHVETSRVKEDIGETISDISNTIDDLEKEKIQKDKEEKLRKEREKKEYLENLMKNEPQNVPNDDPRCHSMAKTYMAYTAVTSVSSPQYKLLNSNNAHTEQSTGLRMYKDRYCIALGSFYASKIGTKVNIELENGTIIKCILGDQKSDNDTDETHRFHLGDGSVVEFIVDYSIFYNVKDSSGTVNFIKNWNSKVTKIVVLD